MNLPKKCGKNYIMFDENNRPLYGFKVEGNKIIKFTNLSNELPEYIVLPKVAKNYTIPYSQVDNRNPSRFVRSVQSYEMHNYVKGNAIICPGCFTDIKQAKIVIPFINSVVFDWGSFDEDADIELIMHKTLELKDIHRTFDNGFGYSYERWTIAGDKYISGNFYYVGDEYSIKDHDKSKRVVANFNVKHLSNAHDDNFEY